MAMMYVKSNKTKRGRVGYITDPEKTGNGIYVSCVGLEPETAPTQMRLTREYYRYTGEKETIHIVQDFLPGEVTPGIAHEIGSEYARLCLSDFQYIVATHIAGSHIHNHILSNLVSDATGLVLSKKEDKQTFFDICSCHGIVPCRELDNAPHISNSCEARMQKAGVLSCKAILHMDADDCMRLAVSEENFYELMHERGYSITQGEKFPLFTPYGTTFRMCLKRNGRGMTGTDIRDRIDAELLNPRPEFPDSRVVDIDVRTDTVPDTFSSWTEALRLVGNGKRIRGMSIPLKEISRYDQFVALRDFLMENNINSIDDLDSLRRKSMVEYVRKFEMFRDLQKWRKDKNLYIAAVKTTEKLRDIPRMYEEGISGTYDDYMKLKKAEEFLSGKDVEGLKKDISEVLEKSLEYKKDKRELKHIIYLCDKAERELPVIEKYLERIPERVRDRNREKYRQEVER